MKTWLAALVACGALCAARPIAPGSVADREKALNSLQNSDVNKLAGGFLQRRQPGSWLTGNGAPLVATTMAPTTAMFTTTPPVTTTMMMTTTPMFTTTMNPLFTTPAPKPPCNWTKDDEGVARPLDCSSMVVTHRQGNSTVSEALTNATNMTSTTVVQSTNMTSTTVVQCKRVSPPVFDEETCEPPNVQECRPLSTLLYPLLYKADGSKPNFPAPHGTTRKIVCADGGHPIDIDVPLDVWAEDWYNGTKEEFAECRNGTWTNIKFMDGGYMSPATLRCAPEETVKLLKQAVHYSRWTNKSVEETEAIPFKWIDSMANLRMTYLKNAMIYVPQLVNATVHGYIPPSQNIQATIDLMIQNRMMPHGEPFTQDTCKDLEQHFLWQLKPQEGRLGFSNYIPPKNEEIGYPSAGDVNLVQPVSFTCNYAVQKTGAGYDPYSGQPTFRFRNGCSCESRWKSGCPFKMSLTPSYQTFGFGAMEEKPVSSAAGAPTNALCWYWSAPAHPEWGYLRSEKGYAFQAPAQNSSQLLKEYNELKAEAKKEYQASK